MCVYTTVRPPPNLWYWARRNLPNDLQGSCVSSAHMAHFGPPARRRSLRLDLGRVALCARAVRICLPVGLSGRGVPDRSRSDVARPSRRSRSELHFPFTDLLHEIRNEQRRDECKDHHNSKAELECSHQSPPWLHRATDVPRRRWQSI